MPTPLAVGDVLELAYVCQATPQFSVNVRHYKVASIGLLVATMEDAASFLSGVFGPLFAASLSANASFWGLKIVRIKPTRSQPFIFTDDRGVGTIAGDLLPRQTAAVIKLRTGAGGRSGRGRMFVPFPSEASNDADGTPLNGYRATVANLANALVATQDVAVGGRTASLEPVVFSRKANTSTLILDALVRTSWGTQRRRSEINRPDDDPLAV